MNWACQCDLDWTNRGIFMNFSILAFSEWVRHYNSLMCSLLYVMKNYVPQNSIPKNIMIRIVPKKNECYFCLMSSLLNEIHWKYQNWFCWFNKLLFLVCKILFVPEFQESKLGLGIPASGINLACLPAIVLPRKLCKMDHFWK